MHSQQICTYQPLSASILAHFPLPVFRLMYFLTRNTSAESFSIKPTCLLRASLKYAHYSHAAVVARLLGVPGCEWAFSWNDDTCASITHCADCSDRCSDGILYRRWRLRTGHGRRECKQRCVAGGSDVHTDVLVFVSAMWHAQIIVKGQGTIFLGGPPLVKV